MQIAKKTVVLMFVVVLGAILANVSAQAQQPSVSVNVPFDFVVGQQTLAAGVYRMQREGEFVSIRSAEGPAVFALLLAGGTLSTQDGTPYIVFTRYGSEAFLNSVVFAADQSYNLSRSSKEKELMSRVSSGEQVAVQMQ